MPESISVTNGRSEFTELKKAIGSPEYLREGDGELRIGERGKGGQREGGEDMKSGRSLRLREGVDAGDDAALGSRDQADDAWKGRERGDDAGLKTVLCKAVRVSRLPGEARCPIPPPPCSLMRSPILARRPLFSSARRPFSFCSGVILATCKKDDGEIESVERDGGG